MNKVFYSPLLLGLAVLTFVLALSTKGIASVMFYLGSVTCLSLSMFVIYMIMQYPQRTTITSSKRLLIFPGNEVRLKGVSVLLNSGTSYTSPLVQSGRDQIGWDMVTIHQGDMRQSLLTFVPNQEGSGVMSVAISNNNHKLFRLMLVFFLLHVPILVGTFWCWVISFTH